MNVKCYLSARTAPKSRENGPSWKLGFRAPAHAPPTRPAHAARPSVRSKLTCRPWARLDERQRGSEGARRAYLTVVLVFAEHDLDRIDVGRVDLTRRIAQGAATDNGDKVLERRLQVHPLPKQKSTRT